MNDDLIPYVVKGEIVAEDAWRLVYWRYQQRYDEGYPTLDEALGAACAMADAGSAAVDYIIRPDGSFLEGEDFFEAREKWDEAHGN